MLHVKPWRGILKMARNDFAQTRKHAVNSKLLIAEVNARAVNVPMEVPHRTAGGVISSYPLVLIDLVTSDGVRGSSYVFTYTPIALKPVMALVNDIGTVVKGQPLVPSDVFALLDKRFRLLGVQGLVGMAISGIDMAMWDALARSLRTPLFRLLGAAHKPIPAYLSLGMDGLDAAPGEAEKAIARGFRAVKIKIGYPDVATDLAVIRAIRRAVGADVKLMVDYNQSLSIIDAKQRLHALAGEQLTWVEEPMRWENFVGNAEIAAESQTPVQMGENWWWPDDAAKALDAKASPFAMLDVMKIGGVTGWLRAAAYCAMRGVPVSSHLFPEFSSHLLAATPTSHWLEYQDWADPILAEPYRVKDGFIEMPERDGVGVSWNETVVSQYLVQ
jgi:mandelate racemase